MSWIDKQKTLDERLHGRPPEIAMAISVRAAMRALALIAEYWDETWSPEGKINGVLAPFRVQLTCHAFAMATDQHAKPIIGIKAIEAAREVKTGGYHSAAAAAALYAVSADTGSLESDITNVMTKVSAKLIDDDVIDQPAWRLAWQTALDSMHRADANDKLVASFFDAANLDGLISDKGGQYQALFALPLWSDATLPNEIVANWRKLQVAFGEDPTTWSFWRDWYQRVLDGAYQNQKLLYDIAVLPNADWEKGPEHIAGLIRDLQAKHLAAVTPIAEEIKVREATGLIYAVPVAMPRAGHLETILDQIGDALGDALVVSNNGLREDDLATEILRRTLSRYRAVPWRVHQDCIRALEALEAEINAGNLPAGDPRLEALRRTLIDSAIGIRTAIPSVKEQYAAELQTRFEELPEETRGQVVAAITIVAEIAEPEFGDEARTDAAIIDGLQPSNELKEALYRWASRLPRIKTIAKWGGLAVLTVGGFAVENIVGQAVSGLFYSYRWGQYQDVPLPPPVAAKPIATQRPPATGG